MEYKIRRTDQLKTGGMIFEAFNSRLTIKDRFYRGAGKSLARPLSRYILSYDENISFNASPLIYINSTNIPPIMIINRIYEHQNLLSL
jgi:hypothetical protein